ncbi:MAG: hypothetical protein QOH61_2689 [Chloroflexota bacterium]|nr:hypothetical protein [Chloroflexota bacterium]
MHVLRAAGAPRFAFRLAVALPLAGFFVAAAASGVLERRIDVAVGVAYLGVFLVALYGGFVPGMVATACTVLLELAVQAAPIATEQGVAVFDPWRLGVFILGGTLASAAAGLVQDARARAELARREESAARIEADLAAERSATLAELSAESRRRAEASSHRLDLLADAGRILGQTLEYTSVLPALARLTIPLLGDVCVIDLEGDDEVRRIVAAGKPLDETQAHWLQGQAPLAEREGRIRQAVEAGRSEVVDLDDPGTDFGGPGAEPLRHLGLHRAMVVPIRIRDSSLGAFLFATTDPARQYEPTDLSTAEVLAQRAAKAIDNGRLHLELQRLASHEQERAAELESVVSAIGEGILVCGSDGEIRVMNAAADRMLAGAVPDLSGLRQRLAPHGETLPDPGVSFGPAEFQLADRRGAWVELTAYPVSAGSETGAGAAATVYVLRDVSAFRQGQRLREAFLGLLSHELRTPVTTIYAAANVLGRPTSTLAPETRQEILGDMIGEADRLYRLVEDLMVLARFDEGIELTRDPNLLQHIVPAVVDNERNRWPQVRFTLTRDDDLPAVNGDDISIQQVLRNLLSNAAKYSPAGSTIEVRVDGAPDGVTVRVLDQGPGIDPLETEDLFDPFYRSPETSAMASGAGIGLYVSRRLVDAMGGRISASRRDGRGSEFRFWLPRYVPLPEDLPADDAPRTDVNAPTAVGPGRPSTAGAGAGAAQRPITGHPGGQSGLDTHL